MSNASIKALVDMVVRVAAAVADSTISVDLEEMGASEDLDLIPVDLVAVVLACLGSAQTRMASPSTLQVFSDLDLGLAEKRIRSVQL